MADTSMEQERDTSMAPKLSKNRRLAKNKKKSWRASNVDDVAEFLEDERRQIRTGGLVAEKADENLFIVDTGIKQADCGPAERRSKRQWQDRQLKCFSLLQPDPHSKSVRTPEQNSFQKGLRKRRILDRLRVRSHSQVRVAAQKQRQDYEETKKIVDAQKMLLPVVDTDLWADVADDQTTKVCKPPERYHKKPSALRATVIPHPGASINPAYEDHQDLLFQAHIKEEKRIKKEKKIYNALEGKFPSKADAPNESTYLEEMSACLLDDSGDEEVEEVVDTPLSLNPPVRREDRKTRKQRRVQKEQEIAAGKRVKEAGTKRRENMILRIPTLKSDINQAERKRKEREIQRQKLKSLQPFQTKRLGKTRFEEPDLDLKLSTELVASLRELKPEGHLLNDIYKSLQRRNIIEPRVRQRVKRIYKPKTFEKKGHKAIKL